MSQESFDPYRALGLPVGATPREIRRRYRQLARKLHPDVRRSGEKATEQFIEVKRAYEMLMDDDMRERLEQQLLGAVPEAMTVVDDFDATLARAGELTERGHYAEAKGLCADLLRARPMEPGIFELLARIYDIEGNELLQKRMEQEVERLRGQRRDEVRARMRGYRDIWQGEPIRKRPLIVALGVLAVAGCVVLVRLSSDEVVLAGFSLIEIAAGLGAGLFGPFCAVAGGLLGPFDEELGGVVAESSGVTAPMWLYLMAAGVVSVGLAFIFYVVFALTEHGFSRDVLGFFAGIVGLAAIVGWAHAGGWIVIMLAGANLILIAGLIGWALGSMLRPGQWWQR